MRAEDDATMLPLLEVGLPTADIARMRRFYVDALGFRHAGTVDLPAAHIERYRSGSCVVKFTLFADEALRPPPRPPSALQPYLTIRVEEIDAVMARCAAAGFRPLAPVAIATTAAGRAVRFAFLVDPSGNRVELVEGDAWERAN